jgi:hypothetical protein
MELSKKQLGGIVTLAMLIAGLAGNQISFDSEKTYYCESRDIVLECHRLSSTAKTCYFSNTSKRCSEGWKPIGEFIELDDGTANFVKVNANGKLWECETEGRFIQPYSKCYSGIYEGYLGELI